MDIAILLYDRFTALDAIGPYEVLSRLPEADVRFVTIDGASATTDTGMLTIQATAATADVPSPDIVVVPGGPGQEDIMEDAAVLGWLRDAHETSTWTTSVCTGSLLLAAAGLLEGRPATCHWLAVPRLADFGATPRTDRVVIDGKVATAAGVSAGIDLGLTLAAAIAGDEYAQMIQLGIEYDPRPPFDAGSPETAPAAIVETMRSMSRHVLGTA